jgi:hypothetical protein
MSKPPPPAERPTAAELAALSRAAAGDVWACPRCGCRDWRVRKTAQRAAGVRRSRVCRHCGQAGILTTEVPCPTGYRVLVVPSGESEEDAA